MSVAAEPVVPLDRFGDPLPEGAIARLGSLRLRPEQPIVTGAFTPDGKLLATADTNRMIVFWDTVTGKEARRMQVNLPGRLRGLRFSTNGRTLLVVGDAGAFRVVDAVRGTEQRKLDLAEKNALVALDVSPSGKVAATLQASGTIQVWDLAADKPLHTFQNLNNNPLWQNAPGQLIALTPDGKQLVLPHKDGSLHLVDVMSGKEVLAFEMPASKRPGARGIGSPQQVAVSPDGRYLAYASRQNAATLCDLKTGKRLRELGPGRVGNTGLAFAPNSRLLAVCGHSDVRVFGIVSGKELRHFIKPFGSNGTVAFSPDGRTLAALGGSTTIPMWDALDDRLVHPVVGHQSPLHALAFFPDGKRLASAGRTDGLIVWDIATGRDRAHQRSNFRFSTGFTVGGDGVTLQYFGLDQAIHRWNPESGDDERQPIPWTGAASQFTPSPDGRSVAVISSTSPPQMALYDVHKSTVARMLALPKTAGIHQPRFTPDSRLLAVATFYGVLNLWDRDTGRLVDEWKTEAATRQPLRLDFAADGRSLALYDGNLRIREVLGGGERIHFPAPGTVTALAYSPDGRFLVRGHPDGSLVVHGTGTGKQLVQWQGRQGAVYALAFSRDGRLLASGGENGTILVWKLPDGEGLPATLKADEATSFWQALAGANAARAHRALAGLAAAPAQTLPLIQEHFRTTRIKPTAERLAQLIAELDADSFKVRERATRQLAEAGSDAADALRMALGKGASPEQKRRIEKLLAQLGKTVDPERLRSLRAIEVLERIGTPQARRILAELGDKDIDPDLREEIRASLRRLDRGGTAAEEAGQRRDAARPD
jgi:WD40 repeat protein